DAELGSPRGPHPGLPGLVEDDVHVGEEAREVEVLQLADGQLETGGEPVEVLALERGVVVVAQRVHAAHVPPVREQRRADARAHESRGARDERPHEARLDESKERTATTANAGPRTR